jgi:hypothetical protein
MDCPLATESIVHDNCLHDDQIGAMAPPTSLTSALSSGTPLLTLALKINFVLKTQGAFMYFFLITYLSAWDTVSRSVPIVGVVTGMNTAFFDVEDDASGSDSISCPCCCKTFKRVDFPEPSAPTHRIILLCIY